MLYVIACGVLAVDIKHTAEQVGTDLEYKFLEGGLHNTPKRLSRKLQQAIDEISEKKDGDRIIIGYGVCGKGTIGIKSRQKPIWGEQIPAPSNPGNISPLKPVDMADPATIKTGLGIDAGGTYTDAVIYDLSENIPHEPKAVVRGALSINGHETQPIDAEQVRDIARRMVKTHQVSAFAVSGYAGSINPAHELEVKNIIEQETGLLHPRKKCRF